MPTSYTTSWDLTRAGRLRGKSDPIEALAVARAALREPRLSRPARTSSRFAI